MATAAQTLQYRLHRDLCRGLSIPQARLRHKTKAAGTIVPASPTGVTRYTGPGGVAGDPGQGIVDVLVWMHQSPKGTRGGDEYELGRTSENRLHCQFPTIDDLGNQVSVSQDDWVVAQDGITYKIDTPTRSEDGGFWVCETEQQR